MNTRFNGHLVIVFALEHYNPLNMIRAFGEQGIKPVYISVKRRYETACRSISVRFTEWIVWRKVTSC